MTFLASLRKELLEQVRTSRLLITGVVLVFFGLTSPLLAKMTPELFRIIPGMEDFSGLIPTPTMLDAVIQYTKNLNQFGVLLALLLAMGMVAQEKERGTAALMLSKPLSRGAFLLAKFSALAITLLVCLAAAGLGAYYYTLILFEAPSAGAWLAMNAFLWVYMLVFVALTLMFSVLVRSQAAAAGLSFGVILILSLLGAFPSIGRYLPAKLLEWSTGLFMSGFEPAWPALGVSLAVIAGSLLAAWAVFRGQEI